MFGLRTAGTTTSGVTETKALTLVQTLATARNVGHVSVPTADNVGHVSVGKQLLIISVPPQMEVSNTVDQIGQKPG